LATQNVSKDYINSINKRIEKLDKEYLNTTSDEEREKNHQKVLELYKLIKEESNDQRDWIKTLGFGALGTIAVIGGIAVVTRNKEVGKKIVEEGIKVIKG
jgi:3-dehydroquinate synthetase